MAQTSEVAFPIEEFAERLAAARAGMAHAGLDVLVACVPENLYYLSGYESTGHFAVQALLVPSTASPSSSRATSRLPTSPPPMSGAATSRTRTTTSPSPSSPASSTPSA